MKVLAPSSPASARISAEAGEGVPVLVQSVTITVLGISYHVVSRVGSAYTMAQEFVDYLPGSYFLEVTEIA